MVRESSFDRWITREPAWRRDDEPASEGSRRARFAPCSNCETVGPVTSVEMTWFGDPTTWGDLCGECLRAAYTDMEVQSVTVLPDELCADCGQTVAGVEVQWGMATPYCPRCSDIASVE